jgi:hypothetical protein
MIGSVVVSCFQKFQRFIRAKSVMSLGLELTQSKTRGAQALDIGLGDEDQGFRVQGLGFRVQGLGFRI